MHSQDSGAFSRRRSYTEVAFQGIVWTKVSHVEPCSHPGLFYMGAVAGSGSAAVARRKFADMVKEDGFLQIVKLRGVHGDLG
jgi:hypothetical protein